MSGLVSIVGAGPGDPDLLTVRAVRRLGDADLVVHDGLVAAFTALAGRARWVRVDKRAGSHQIRQEEIHAILINASRQGRRVVRLKCGDPFVLGRGGEEALALAAAGIPFELIPGVSSSVAAAELAGIPVTHRGVSQAFLVVSGHAPEAYAPVLGSLTPGSTTLVVLMGMAGRSGLAHFLVDHGWDPRTPSAVVLGAATPACQVWTGPLLALGEAAVQSGGEERIPGTIVIGEVVDLARTIRPGMFDHLERAALEEREDP